VSHLNFQKGRNKNDNFSDACDEKIHLDFNKTRKENYYDDLIMDSWSQKCAFFSNGVACLNWIGLRG
jgi:hypothetical protein